MSHAEETGISDRVGDPLNVNTGSLALLSSFVATDLDSVKATYRAPKKEAIVVLVLGTTKPGMKFNAEDALAAFGYFYDETRTRPVHPNDVPEVEVIGDPVKPAKKRKKS